MNRNSTRALDLTFALARRFALLVLLSLLVIISSRPLPVLAATVFYVSPSGNDANTCTDPIASPCKTIGGALGKAPAGSTINVAAGIYHEHLLIMKDISIVGSGTSATMIDGSSSGRVIEVSVGAIVSISSLTVRNGYTASTPDNSGAGILNSTGGSRLTLSAVNVISNVVAAGTSCNTGGGILNQSWLTATNGIISGNSACRGGGLFNAGAATVVLSNTIVSDNLATQAGGLYNYGDATLTNVTLHANTATTTGGGLRNPGVVIMTNSTIDGNRAGDGGGMSNEGHASLTNVTLSGNQTTAGIGAGLYNSYAAVVTLSNATLSDNVTPESTDGGLVNDGIVNIRNSIVANTVGGVNCSDTGNVGTDIVSSGYNLSSDTSCAAFFTGPGDLNNKNPLLRPLGNWGGLTRTHALLSGSPAINAGNPGVPGSGGNTCAATDQRGVVRPVGGRCDIGAYEGSVPWLLSLPLILR